MVYILLNVKVIQPSDHCGEEVVHERDNSGKVDGTDIFKTYLKSVTDRELIALD